MKTPALRNDFFSEFLAKQGVYCLFAYFIFVFVLMFTEWVLPVDFAYWFQASVLQLVLLTFLGYLWILGWKPRWRINTKGWLWFAGFLLVYLGGLKVLDLSLAYFQGEVGLSQRTTMQPWYFMILQLVLAPVFEELFFRDYLLRSFWQKLGSWGRALFFTSAFFMLAHLSLYPGAFLLGLVAGGLYLLTGSIIPAVVFHSLSNLSLYLLPVFYPSIFQWIVQTGWLEVFYR